MTDQVGGDVSADHSDAEPASLKDLDVTSQARPGVLPVTMWVAAGGAMTALLLIALFVGSAGIKGEQKRSPTLTATVAIVTPTTPAPPTPTSTPVPPTPTLISTSRPPTATPQPPTETSTFTPTPTRAWPTWTQTVPPTLTPTPVICPGNQIWKGAECTCPPGMEWVAQSQWCVEKAK